MKLDPVHRSLLGCGLSLLFGLLVLLVLGKVVQPCCNRVGRLTRVCAVSQLFVSMGASHSVEPSASAFLILIDSLLTSGRFAIWGDFKILILVQLHSAVRSHSLLTSLGLELVAGVHLGSDVGDTGQHR